MSAIDDLPPLSEVVREHGLSAQKSLGQNFLFDLNLTAKIARTAGTLAGHTIIEVGPGPGGLTRAILAAGAERVVVIERDRRCLPALEQISAHYPGRLEIIEGDALKVDMAAIASGPARIIANLPYNVGTQLLVSWITTETWPPFWSSLTLMFQKEVAERIVARPGEDAYGRLGVLAGWRTRSTIMFDISPKAFMPPPKVTSSVVHIVPRENVLPCRLASLEAVTAAAFGQRRKMLRQSLKSLGRDPGPLLEQAGLEPTARAETISIEGFVALANALDNSATG
ncbi:Ribosomal RNA small subunit methyltransferase A [Hartmannibacter diazotrophicus]|uniref:Ribosomal RNA small subunit methyltransferase A n=1 Tax=Hartmannibacter diazotrophicus TaxID=1482074 RepID=A0A2C9D707_9HYPH|nr:16S rRNA (adenine(1518)-N(6)/adenine(1519)-N(6))-dimethyltransferase RsmA [Hartmannibacter diazotrophicus]SON55959.1 Ribosomal RNA small subunit methyltransferase A [Hartmannibacter diazotrophicus]